MWKKSAQILRRNYATNKDPTGNRISKVSVDLLTSASMGYSGAMVPRTHTEHLEALVGLNLFDDLRIEMSLNRFNKEDFCTKKPFEKLKDEVEFNPFSLDP